jgi:outer membrane lipoprotein SlyB
MNAPVQNFPQSRMPPMLVIVAIAVILFCAVGIAAIMGWIPASRSSNPDVVVAAVPEKAATPVKHAAPVAQVTHRPVAVAVAPARAVCANCGVVESTREINTRAEGSGVGAAGGAVVGGLLGNQVGGGNGKTAATVVGAIGGAVIGNQIEGKVRAVHSYETTVRLEDGSTRAIQQAEQPVWRTGDRVKLVDGVLRSNA